MSPPCLFCVCQTLTFYNQVHSKTDAKEYIEDTQSEGRNNDILKMHLNMHFD